jgi:ribosomal protein L29
MKKREVEEMHKKDVSTLTSILSEKRLEFTKASSEIKLGKEKNFKKAKNLRKEIAQLSTLIREKVLTEAK